MIRKPVEVRGAGAESVREGRLVAHPIEVTEGAVHLALAAVEVGLAEAVAVLVVTEGGAVGGAGAFLGAVYPESPRRAGVAVARHVVTTVADGAVAHRVAALAIFVHFTSEGEETSHFTCLLRGL